MFDPKDNEYEGKVEGTVEEMLETRATAVEAAGADAPAEETAATATDFVLAEEEAQDAQTAATEEPMAESAEAPLAEADTEKESPVRGQYQYYQFEQQEMPQEELPKVKKTGGLGKLVKCVGVGVLVGAVAFGTMYGLVEATGVFDQYKKDPAPVLSTTTKVDPTATVVTNSEATVYDVSAVVESVMPSVVAITNTGMVEVETFFGTQMYDSQSSGSGIIVGENETELLIATNNHVISGATNLAITFDDETTAEAIVKGTSNEMDLAVVAVSKDAISEETKSHIRVATIGDSDELKVGEPAIAIGNALGYGQSTTYGIISALNREVTVQTDSTYGFGNSKTITSQLIQTDAAINPGNSGGALLNIKGELIGINSVKYSSEEVEGMGYAIPITAAQPILDELMTRETRTRITDEEEVGYLGIQGAEVTAEAVQIYGMPAGAFVVRVVEDGAAEDAGIRKGDVITEFDGDSISSMEELSDLLYYYRAGEEVDVVIARSEGGEYIEETIVVKLGSRADMEED